MKDIFYLALSAEIAWVTNTGVPTFTIHFA